MLPLLPTSNLPKKNPVATINIEKGKKTSTLTNDPSQHSLPDGIQQQISGEGKFQ